VTCFTGDDDLCDMTEAMLSDLWRTSEGPVDELKVSIVAQGAARETGYLCDIVTVVSRNIGFAFGMNQAIEAGHTWEPDYVLVLNNDLLFPDYGWFAELMNEARSDCVSSPATDVTARHPQEWPTDEAPRMVQQLSAYAWLVPFAWCQDLKERYGYWLFDEEFAPAYGEDDWAAFVLSKLHGPKVFQLVHRSWVKHLKARTSATVTCDRRKTSKLLADRLRKQLTRANLRRDLRQWATNLLRILKC